MSPELIAIVAAAAMIPGLLWSPRRYLAGVHGGAAGDHRGIVGLRRRAVDLRGRMARLEGLFEGFTRRDPSALPA